MQRVKKRNHSFILFLTMYKRLFYKIPFFYMSTKLKKECFSYEEPLLKSRIIFPYYMMQFIQYVNKFLILVICSK